MAKIIMYRDKFVPIIGGIETHIANIVKNSPEYQFEIITNALKHEKKIESYTPNSVIHRVPPTDYTLTPFSNSVMSKMTFPYRIWTDLIRYNRKIKYLKKSDYDLLHIHSHDICSNFLRVDRKLKKLHLTKTLNFSEINRPILFTFHGLYSLLQPDDKIACLYDEKFINAFDNLVAVDEHIHIALKKHCENNDLKKNIWYIPNSVDTETYKYLPPQDSKTIKLGFMGRIEDNISGLPLLKELIARKPSWLDISVVGAGSINSIQKFKAESNIDKINFIPNLPPEQIPNFLSGIDILFNPVLTGAITRVTLEAMSCGRPVIMIGESKRGPIIDGENSYLIENNIDSLLNLLSVIHENKINLTKIGKNARSTIEREYSNEILLPRLANIYRKLLNESHNLS